MCMGLSIDWMRNICVSIALSLVLMSAASAQTLGFSFDPTLGYLGVELIVVDVTPGTTADQMGLRPDDIIERVNGMAFPIQQSIPAIQRSLRKRLGARGGEIVLHVRRNGELGTLQGRLEPMGGSGRKSEITINIFPSTPSPALPYETWRPAMEPLPDPGFGAYVEGFVEPLTGTRYLQVKRVFPGGLAHANHVRVGEVILGVDGRKIETLPDFTDAWARAGRAFELIVKSTVGEVRVIYVRR